MKNNALLILILLFAFFIPQLVKAQAQFPIKAETDFQFTEIVFIGEETSPTIEDPRLKVYGKGEFTESVSGATASLDSDFATLGYVNENIFWTGGTNNSIFNLNTGNVGIGTASPAGALEVVHGTNMSLIFNFDSPYLGLALKNKHTGTNARGFNIINSSDVGIASFSTLMNDGALSYAFIGSGPSAYNSPWITFMPAGNIGINTTTPGFQLDVSGTGRFTQPIIVGTPTDDTHAVTRNFLESYVGDEISGVDASNWEVVGNNIYNRNTGNVGIGTSNIGSLLTIANNEWISAVDDSGTGFVNMFRVNTSNQIEVGGPLNIGSFEFSPNSGLVTFVDMPVTSASSAGTPHGYALKIDQNTILGIYAESDGSGGIQNERVGIGTMFPNEKLTVAGNVEADQYFHSSDINLKTNIISLDNNINKIRQLNPVSFNWKDGDGHLNLGFIAQEIEKVLPELVKTNQKNGLKSVQYANLTAVLVGGMKEQQEKIDRLELEIEILKRKIEKMNY